MKLTNERILNALPVIVTIIMIAVCRLMPHPWNFTPVTAAAIFGGIYLNKKWALILPVASMLIADVFLGFSFPDIPFVYGSIMLSVWIGFFIGKKRENKPQFTLSLISGTVGSGLLFYIVTNFGSWLTLEMYAKNLSGLLQSYVLALPFLKNSLTGDLIFIVVFVAGFESLSWLLSRNARKPVAVVAK